MKKIIFSTLLLLATMGTNSLKAQLSVSVNIGTPPAWAPYGYNDERFYFIPDIDVYYDVWYSNYWYLDRGNWICVDFLPPRYARFDLYNCYKVPISYRGGRPYLYYRDHCNRYYSYRNYRGPRQYTYRDYGGYRNTPRPRAHYENQRPRNDYGRGGDRPRNDYDRPDRDRNDRPDYNNGRQQRPEYRVNNNRGERPNGQQRSGRVGGEGRGRSGNDRPQGNGRGGR